MTSPRSATHLDMQIGARIRAAREHARLSQSDLGAKVGVTFQQIQKYESGRNRITAHRLQTIASALGVPVPQLLTDEKYVVVMRLGEPVFSFASEQEWINRGPRIWKVWQVDGGRGIAIDAKGRICQMGAHFMRATRESAYPVTVYRVQPDDRLNGSDALINDRTLGLSEAETANG